MDAFAEAWGQTVTAHWFDRGNEPLPSAPRGRLKKNCHSESSNLFGAEAGRIVCAFAKIP
jgi:hypothetical protein